MGKPNRSKQRTVVVPCRSWDAFTRQTRVGMTQHKPFIQWWRENVLGIHVPRQTDKE